MDDWGFVMGMDIRSGQISDDVRGTIDYAEVALLEFWFEGEAKCESAHSESECSGLVVGVKRVLCSGDVFRVCRSSFEWNRSVIADPGFVCSGCGLPCGVCWRVVLV